MIGIDPKKPMVTPVLMPYSIHEKWVKVIVGTVQTKIKYGTRHLNGGLKYLTKYINFIIISVVIISGRDLK